MKPVFQPLKVATEAIWLVGRGLRRVAKKVIPMPPMGSRSDYAVDGAPPPPVAPVVELQPVVLASLKLGQVVHLRSATTRKGRAVSAGAVGRVHRLGEGTLDFLTYLSDGVPVLLPGLSPEQVGSP